MPRLPRSAPGRLAALAFAAAGATAWAAATEPPAPVPPPPATRLLSAATVLVVLLAWESFAPFFAWFRRHPAERVRHGLRNLALGALNSLVVALAFVPLWLAVTRWAAEHSFGLLHWLGVAGAGRPVLAVVLLDLWTWAWHALNHRVPFLWRFHHAHHTERRMDVTTASRFHVGEIALSALLRLPILALLGVHLAELAVYETLLFAVVQFHHANIRLPASIESWLRWLVVTPTLHRVHHSQDLAESNSNYASLLPLWDRLFGTWRWHDHPHAIRYGVAGDDAPEHQTLPGLLALPRPANDDRRGRRTDT